MLDLICFGGLPVLSKNSISQLGEDNLGPRIIAHNQSPSVKVC